MWHDPQPFINKLVTMFYDNVHFCQLVGLLIHLLVN